LFQIDIVFVWCQELDSACGEAVCRLFSTDWSCTDAMRAAEKARLTLTMRGVDISAVLHEPS